MNNKRMMYQALAVLAGAILAVSVIYVVNRGPVEYWTLQRMLALGANILAVLVLGWKLGYDRWWNPRKYERESAGKGRIASLDAAERKRDRSEWSAGITFLVLAVSYFLFIIETLLP